MDQSFLSGNNTKAGLPELSRERIDQIILEASKNSKYYHHQQRRQQQVSERAQHLRQRHFSPADLDQSKVEINSFINSLQEATAKQGPRVFVHVDMDAFFAAVEQLHRPELATVPMAVGGESMLCTANYEARKFGVSAAMPGFIARKLCPSIQIVPVNFGRYKEASERVHAVFRLYDPGFCSFSLDEASLDFTTHFQKSQTSVEEVVLEMRERVRSSTGLTCSAGIGPTRQQNGLQHQQTKRSILSPF
jgi:DNA polymerase kappa